MKIIMLASLIAPAAAFTAPGARTSATRFAATRAFSGSSSLFANPKGTSHRHFQSRLHAVSVTRRIITIESSLFSVHPYMQFTSIWKLAVRKSGGLRSNSVPMLSPRPPRTSVHFVPERKDTDMREARSIGEGGSSTRFFDIYHVGI